MRQRTLRNRPLVLPSASLLSTASVLLAAGAALLATFIKLGRPPISPPTFVGLVTFAAATATVLLLLELETLAATRLLALPRRRARALVVAGATPLGLAWPLVGALYVPEIHHWFATVASVKPAMAIAVVLPTVAFTAALLAVAARERVLATCWRYRYALAAVAYGGLAVAAKPSLWHIDLPGWFVPAAKLVLAGRPLEMYSVRADVMGTPAPLEHGPLTILFYVPFVALAEVMGKTDFLRVGAIFPLLGIVLLDCAMAYQATRAIKDLAPRVSERHLFSVAVLILFSPLLWFSSVWLVHLESLNALLVVGAVRFLARRHAVAGGALLGSALLLKHSAALAGGPMLVALFLAGYARPAVVAGITAGLVMALGLAPFAIAAPGDFTFNFAGYDAIKPIYGLTIWKASYESGIEPLIMRLDSLMIGLLALANAAALGLLARRRRLGRVRHVRLVSPRTDAGHADRPADGGVAQLCWMAIVLGQIAWLGLATWQYPHYFVLGFVALLIWETAGMMQRRDGDAAPGWPVLSLLFLFVPYNLQAHFPSNVGKAGGVFVVARATAQLAFLYGCAIAVWIRAHQSLPGRQLALGRPPAPDEALPVGAGD